MSPDDRLILDRHVRFIGDAVAIVAGETEDAVDKSIKKELRYNIEWKHQWLICIKQKR